MNLAWLETGAWDHPGKTASVDPDGSEHTYAELDALSNRMGNIRATCSGVSPASVVTPSLEPHPMSYDSLTGSRAPRHVAGRPLIRARHRQGVPAAALLRPRGCCDARGDSPAVRFRGWRKPQGGRVPPARGPGAGALGALADRSERRRDCRRPRRAFSACPLWGRRDSRRLADSNLLTTIVQTVNAFLVDR